MGGIIQDDMGTYTLRHDTTRIHDGFHLSGLNSLRSRRLDRGEGPGAAFLRWNKIEEIEVRRKGWVRDKRAGDISG